MTASTAGPAGGRAAEDDRWMRAALALAARGLGRVWPNPAVGCVVVGGGRAVGRGWTQPGGRPHAETEALRRAGAAARGATAYVSLEPCNHHAKTPPCTDALIAAGVARVVVACEDPDPRVDGAGVARLRAAGIEVETGVLAAEACALNEGFFRRIREGRPAVTLKIATSLDGRIATRTGESRWITGPEARALAHAVRARHDAVMVGIGTAVVDDPELTCRLPGMRGRSPVRIVADSRLRLPLTSRLVATAREVPTWVLCLPGAPRARLQAFADAGVDVIEVPDGGDHVLDLAAAMRALGSRGLTRVMVEGGGRLAAALMAADLVDRVEWFRAPVAIGGDGVPALAGWGLERLADARRFRRTGQSAAGDDAAETYVRRRS
jgi:diaminohydroxyphosphoribosylaminopyrimidine deaminase/5-amino-6-(5-phosphoribosylamino)uracil reductase